MSLRRWTDWKSSFSLYFALNMMAEDAASSQLQMLAADFMIETDTRDYDFADFAEARAIAKIGELATQKLLPEIRATWIALLP